MMNEKFSVLLSVYAFEKPIFLQLSLESIINQSLKPELVLIVKDGVIPEDLDKVIQRFVNQFPTLFEVVGYKVNQGLGVALSYGLQFVKTPYVFRMDADDVAAPERFEKQLSFFLTHPEVDVVGSNISEFVDQPDQPIRLRKVPEHHVEIYSRAKLINPMNHMTVGFKTKKVLDVGGYKHAPFFEDYDLWTRMLLAGSKFYNIQEPLVMARVGNDMVGRRHGWSYCKSELRHFRKMYDRRFISFVEYLKVISIRIPLRLVPKKILAVLYSFVLRKKYG